MDEIIHQSEVFYTLGVQHERQRIYQILQQATTLDEYKFAVELLSQ